MIRRACKSASAPRRLSNHSLYLFHAATESRTRPCTRNHLSSTVGSPLTATLDAILRSVLDTVAPLSQPDAGDHFGRSVQNISERHQSGATNLPRAPVQCFEIGH